MMPAKGKSSRGACAVACVAISGDNNIDYGGTKRDRLLLYPQFGRA